MNNLLEPKSNQSNRFILYANQRNTGVLAEIERIADEQGISRSQAFFKGGRMFIREYRNQNTYR